MSQAALFAEGETYARKKFEMIDTRYEEVLTFLRSLVKKIKFISIEMWLTSLALMFLRSILCLRVLHSPFFKDELFFMSKWRTCRKTCPSLFSFKKAWLLSWQNSFAPTEGTREDV